MTLYSMPRLRASSLASSTDSWDEKGEGISSARTFSAPSASAAIEATTAESMPPERPIEAFR